MRYTMCLCVFNCINNYFLFLLLGHEWNLTFDSWWTCTVVSFCYSNTHPEACLRGSLTMRGYTFGIVRIKQKQPCYILWFVLTFRLNKEKRKESEVFLFEIYPCLPVSGSHKDRVVTSTFNILSLFKVSPPQKCLHPVVAVGLVQLCDPESNAGGSLTTSRATHADKVKG
jgi:hypothetical protein